jgi:Right handed beta helix region
LAVLALAVPACSNDSGASDLRAVTAGAQGAKLPPSLPLSRGTTFYVSTRGSDSNPGTRARPWRTVQKALDTLRPGQRALVARGTYSENHTMERAGTRAAPITIAAQTRGVVLHAEATRGDTYPIRFTDGAAYVRLTGFVLERARGTSSTNVYFEGNAHHIELSRNEIRYSQDQGVFAERTTRNLHIVGNRIHRNGFGHVSGQHQSHGIYIEGRNHLIANNVIHDHPHGFGIQVYPGNTGTTIVHNTIVGAGHSGIVVGGDEGVSGITIRNNVIAFNANYGVQMDSDCPTGRVAIDRNVIHGNPEGPVQRGCSNVSTAGGNVLSDPRFVSRGARNYRVRGGSPAIDRARGDYSLRRDFDGRRRPTGAGYDIGAFERAR